MIKYFCDFCDKETEQLKPIFTDSYLEQAGCKKCEILVKEFKDKEYESYQNRFKVIRDEYEAKLKKFIEGMK